MFLIVVVVVVVVVAVAVAAVRAVTSGVPVVTCYMCTDGADGDTVVVGERRDG
jgi:hypothetical protein